MDLDKQNDSSLHRHFDKKYDPRILKNLDSSNQCKNTELGDLTEPQMSSSGDHLNTVASENGIDGSSALLPVELATLGPSLFQDLLFSIIDLSTNWAYENSETEVLVVGRFLKSQELESFKWSCMFGEVEVPAEVVADGVLRCYTPVHRAARIPFYVTCSNRLPCSEVRIFEYRVGLAFLSSFSPLDPAMSPQTGHPHRSLTLRSWISRILSGMRTIILDWRSIQLWRLIGPLFKASMML